MARIPLPGNIQIGGQAASAALMKAGYAQQAAAPDALANVLQRSGQRFKTQATDDMAGQLLDYSSYNEANADTVKLRIQ